MLTLDHPHDALQYLMLGGGEGRVVLRREQRRQEAVEADLEPVMMTSVFDLADFR